MSSSSTSLYFLRTFMSKNRFATIFGQFLPNRLSSISQKSIYFSSSKSKESLSCDLRTKGLASSRHRFRSRNNLGHERWRSYRTRRRNDDLLTIKFRGKGLTKKKKWKKELNKQKKNQVINHLSTVHTMCAIILSCLRRWCLQYKSQRITVRLQEVLASKATY